MRLRTVMRRLAAVAGGSALAAAALLPGGASLAATTCGLTTLDGTIGIGDGVDGSLVCLPGQPIVTRADLAAPQDGREGRREALMTFLSLADFQLADEESPLRGEWADKCGNPPTSAAFRPHESFVPHLLNAHVLAANAIAQAGSPMLADRFDFAVALGDLADNQQYNEVRAFIDILDGGHLVDPDSGADGYEGVQGVDPIAARGIAAPGGVLGPLEDFLDLANEPFLATGLRHPSRHHLPWYSVLGNHDVKVQGTIPDDNEAWRQFARAWVVGGIHVNDLAPDHQQAVCADPSVLLTPEFWMNVAANPGTTRLVTPDPDRRLLDRADWMHEHGITTGVPVGHGFLEADNDETRCTDAAGTVLQRGCYAFEIGPFRFIALDTNPAEGFESGNIDEDQFAWLERELVAHSHRYFTSDGAEVLNPGANNRMIVVLSHHTISSTTNTGTIPGSSTAKTGDDLRALLLRFPNVILQANGHTHENKIWAHEDEARGTGFWEVNTSAIADYPTQSRTIEIADNKDGTLSIFAVVFDAGVPPNARGVAWGAEDPTDEAALGPGVRQIDETWLASAGREVMFHDPQRDLMKLGEPEDRNVELVIRRPF